MVVNIKSKSDFLNLQDDKLEFTKERNWQNVCILLVIIWSTFESYKTYKYWESKILGQLGNI